MKFIFSSGCMWSCLSGTSKWKIFKIEKENLFLYKFLIKLSKKGLKKYVYEKKILLNYWEIQWLHRILLKNV